MSANGGYRPPAPVDHDGDQHAVDRYVVRPSGTLAGEVRIGGAKNSVLKLMAATLSAAGRYRLDNVPRITDVALMAELLRATGCSVAWDDGAEAGALVIDVPTEIEPVAPYELVERFRASIVALGPMIARCGEARVALPGGDDFGHRPIDMHLRGLAELGVEFSTEHGYISARSGNLTGARVLLEFPSVGATENVLMASTRAKGTTIIDNAAREPEITDLCEMLAAMGAHIEGAGTSTLSIEGVETLSATDHEVISDRIEAATFLCAVGIAGGDVRLRGARLDHMAMLAKKLREMGIHVDGDDEGISVIVGGRVHSADCSTLPYPGLATDYKPFLVSLLATADGVGIVTENLFAGRFRYVDELVRMGADIRTDSHHAVVRGVRKLSGAPVRAHDIRAGAALAIAGLAAEGETVVTDAHHIARGYEDLPGKLRALGADITCD